jgi:hypothetical protein
MDKVHKPSISDHRQNPLDSASLRAQECLILSLLCLNSSKHDLLNLNAAALLSAPFPSPRWLLSRFELEIVLSFLLQLLNPLRPGLKLGGVAPERLQIKSVAK